MHESDKVPPNCGDLGSILSHTFLSDRIPMVHLCLLRRQNLFRISCLLCRKLFTESLFTCPVIGWKKTITSRCQHICRTTTYARVLQINIPFFDANDVRGAYDQFPDFFLWALLLIVHTWNSSPLRSNLLRLQCTCTVPTTSGRPHGSPLVWACQ